MRAPPNGKSHGDPACHTVSLADGKPRASDLVASDAEAGARRVAILTATHTTTRVRNPGLILAGAPEPSVCPIECSRLYIYLKIC